MKALVHKYILINPASIAIFVCVVSVFFNVYFLDGNISTGLVLYVYGIFVLILSFFILSVILSTHISDKNKAFQYVVFKPRLVVLLYWLLASLGLILSLYKIYSIGFNGQFSSLFLNLRHEHTVVGGSSYGAQHFSLFGLSLALYYAYHKNLRSCFIASFIFLISALSVAERTSIFFLFVSVSYLLYFRGVVKLKFLIVLFLLMLALFVSIAIGAGKLSGESNYDFIFNYVGYGITNFSDYVYNRPYEGCGRLVFGTIYNIFQFDDQSCTNVSHLFSVRDRFNVYTYASSPYLYAGWLGVTVFMFLLGAWYAFLWFMAKFSNGYFLTLLSVYIYALSMIFYAWQFSLTTYIYLTILLAPLFFNLKFNNTNWR